MTALSFSTRLGIEPPATDDALTASVRDAIQFVVRRGGGTLRIVIRPGAAGFDADKLEAVPLDDADHGWKLTGTLDEDDLARLAGSDEWPPLQRCDVVFEPAPALRLEQGAASADLSGSAHRPSLVVCGENGAGAASCHVKERVGALPEAGR